MFEVSSKTIEWITKLLGLRHQKSPVKEEKFSLIALGLPEAAFHVIRFRGQEGLNQCYRFEFELLSEIPNLDQEKALMAEALFLINRGPDLESRIPFYGVFSEFEQKHKVHDYVFYRAVMVPKLWWLTQTRHNQVFLDKTLTEMLSEVLQDGGLKSNEFEFRLSGDYSQKREYVCQYKESHYSFFSRWLEHQGLYYFFEVSDEGEKVVVTDTRISHYERNEGTPLTYHQPSGLAQHHQDEILSRFNCQIRRIPKTVVLQDYNYRRPSLKMIERAEVSANGVGELFLYGDHFQTPEEGARLAGIRAQELLCQGRSYTGRSSVPFIRPGYLFQLNQHYQNEFNAQYLTTTVEHEGQQIGLLSASLSKIMAKTEKEPTYQNTFTAIPSSIQFRPPRITEKPVFNGTFNAKIDASGSGQYAELDHQGRYKVLLPFDLSGREKGKASTWLRMAQPYAGTNHGMHFPLHKNTEVLLTFIDGDPDRPVIAGAVPNPETPSVVNASSATKAGFTTAGGTGLIIEDKQGQERTTFRSGGGAMLSFGRSSPSEFFQTGNFYNAYASIGSSTLAGALGSYMSILSYSVMTGYPWIQLATMTAESLLNAAPTLIGTIGVQKYGSDEDPSNPTISQAQQWQGMTKLLAPLGLLVTNTTVALIKAAIMARRTKFIRDALHVPKPGFSVFRTPQGSILSMDRTSPDIALVSSSGSIELHADKNTWLTSKSDKVLISAGTKVEALGETGVDLSTNTGDIKIETKTQGNILIAPAANGNITIGPGNTNQNETTTVTGSLKLELSCRQAAEKSSLVMTKTAATLDGAQTIEINAQTSVVIKNDNHEITLDRNGITITSSGTVKVKGLEVTDQKMTFPGQTAFGQALRVTG